MVWSYCQSEIKQNNKTIAELEIKQTSKEMKKENEMVRLGSKR